MHHENRVLITIEKFKDSYSLLFVRLKLYRNVKPASFVLSCVCIVWNLQHEMKDVRRFLFFFLLKGQTDDNPENRMQAAHHLDEVLKKKKKKRKSMKNMF